MSKFWIRFNIMARVRFRVTSGYIIVRVFVRFGVELSLELGLGLGLGLLLGLWFWLLLGFM